MRKLSLLSWSVVVFVAGYMLFPRDSVAAPRATPNVVVVLVDDMGYGDLSAYGNPVHRTPNIDQLAEQGQRWTSFYAAAPVCTPSRGGLLTGRLPARLGLEAPRGMPNVFFSFSTGGLPHTEITLPQLLKRAGYSTALIGKWHLGYTPEHSPTRHGFDYFFGTPSSNDHDPVGGFSFDRIFEEPDSAHWNVQLRRNESVLEQPARQETLTARFTDDAVDFIDRHRRKPFFLLLAYTMPHVPLFASAQFRGRSGGGLYGDVIEEIDEGVGRILATLRRHGVDRNTIVVFTSDNGPMDMFRERGGSAGPLRGGKGSTWEGGMRVPGIFWAPGRIRPGTVRDPGSQLDLLPTLADIAGQRLPDDRSFDGVSLRATLQTLAPSPRRRIAYYRQGELYAIREGRLKAHFVTEDGFGVDTQRSVHNPALVFDLGQDPAERYPLDKPSPEVLASFSESKKAFERDVIFAPSELVKGVPSRRAEDNETR